MMYGDHASVVMVLWWCFCDDATRLVYFIFDAGRMAVLATSASTGVLPVGSADLVLLY
jgi:hypothetical protein